MDRMTPEEMDAFMREPRIANIATLRPDGSPHVTPVWHHYDGERVIVLCEQSAVKLRNLRRDPRVSVCITTDDEPYMYVLVDGTVAISEDRIPELVHSMAVRYMGREEGERYTERVLEELLFAVLTITPTKVVGWVDRS